MIGLIHQESSAEANEHASAGTGMIVEAIIPVFFCMRVS